MITVVDTLYANIHDPAFIYVGEETEIAELYPVLVRAFGQTKGLTVYSRWLVNVLAHDEHAAEWRQFLPILDRARRGLPVRLGCWCQPGQPCHAAAIKWIADLVTQGLNCDS